jgi:hypothetical protein
MAIRSCAALLGLLLLVIAAAAVVGLALMQAGLPGTLATAGFALVALLGCVALMAAVTLLLVERTAVRLVGAALRALLPGAARPRGSSKMYRHPMRRW